MAGPSLPQGSQLQGVDRLVREPVDALVAGDAGVPRHPVPLELMAGGELIEPLPQVLVLHRLAGGGAPAARLPFGEPLGDAAANVFRIGVQARPHRALERLERPNHRRQLHAVVGREGFRAVELLLALARLQQCRPAAGPRIAAAGAVGVDLDHARERVVGLTRPPITAGFSRTRRRIGVRVYTRLRARSRYAPAGSG